MAEKVLGTKTLSLPSQSCWTGCVDVLSGLSSRGSGGRSSGGNDTHQRAGAIRADVKADPTASFVACDCYPPCSNAATAPMTAIATTHSSMVANHRTDFELDVDSP